MKTNGFKMSFGFSAVNAGQRNTVVEPQIIAVSNEGSFRITPPVSKALGIGHGDYVMFINNVDSIDAAILNKTEEVIDFCAQNGLDITSPEAAIALHNEFDMWAIAKGVVEYDSKGNQKVVQERLTKDDKLKFVSQNFDSMLNAAMEEATDEVKAALSRDGISMEEQIDILSAFVTPRELPKCKGSKAANAAGLTGSGVSLTFTDSNVWKQLKVDMGDEANKMNRIYEADIDNIQDVELNDGYKNIVVKAVILGSHVDKTPVRVGKRTED